MARELKAARAEVRFLRAALVDSNALYLAAAGERDVLREARARDEVQAESEAMVSDALREAVGDDPDVAARVEIMGEVFVHPSCLGDVLLPQERGLGWGELVVRWGSA